MTVFLPLIPACVVSIEVLFLVHYSSLCILPLSEPFPYLISLLELGPITFMLTTHNFSFPSIHRILT